MNRWTLVRAAVIAACAWQQPARATQDATAQGQRGGRAGGAPAVSAPPPGSAGIYKTNADLMAILEKATEATPAMSTSPVANTDQYRINIVRRGRAAGAIAHAGNTELHYLIEGSATFVTGGTIVRPSAAGAAAEIQGGVSRRVARGDVIVIPENSPHWYKDVDGSITYLEVRFVAPAK